MSEAVLFFLAAGALLLIALLILSRPLWRGEAATPPVVWREANLALLRDELRELECGRDAGTLGEREFEQAKSELQRRLLEETEAETPAVPASPTAAGRRTILALFVAIPLAAAAVYVLLGTPRALDPAYTRADASPREIDALLHGLSERLEANPDDLAGRVLLARSYKALGRFAESAEAFAKAETLLDDTPALLADYAEVLALTNGGRFDGKPDALIARSLAGAPDEPRVLFVAGAAANARQDVAAVVDYWGRLLLQLDPDSDDARALGEAVDQARRMLGDREQETEDRRR
ncbi:MAG: c-type cytochrome biogenesis protein CcmI [Candidatus Accumulibacter sp.]|jgi:cytochrome c-type biogenesis protein CcmH|nr:c-type cytochrome biogenesis protein CcmI [Accumulibacter sp.]